MPPGFRFLRSKLFDCLPPALRAEVIPLLRVHRRSSCETLRHLQHRSIDQHRHRVQIAGQRLQAQALSLQRDGAATCERIEHRRRPVGETPLNFRPGPPQHISVPAVLPHHQVLQDPEQALALDGLILLGRKPVRVRRRIVHQRSPQHSPTSRQRLPRPPQMQRRRMPMTDRLLPRRRLIDRIQRQRHLNELRLRDVHTLTLSLPRL